MRKQKTIDDTIEDLERNLAICKFVKEKYPDVKYHQNGNYSGFSSKSVNPNYTNFEFLKTHESLFVVPYIELPFCYNGIIQNIRVNTSPRSFILAKSRYSFFHKQKVLKFSNFKLNFRRNKFKLDMVNACKIEIANFIKNNKEAKLIDKNLDSSIKKLLCFI